MEINYYRQPNIQGTQESWESCQFTSDTNLSGLTARPLVTINGQHILRQHHVTYLTGKETCRAHHFAKHLAIQVLKQPASRRSGCKVLWIDTLHGPHIAAAIYRELASHAISKQDLHFTCLDVLGGQRYDFWFINRAIETLIKQKKPDLVVIDDIDHFMPYCGVKIATEVNHVIRDVLNHSETAFLLIGYNHLSKKASTTGNLGKHLFMSASDVFSLSTQRDVTTVRHAISYDLSCHPDVSEFHFTIGPDNLPHETTPAKQEKDDSSRPTSQPSPVNGDATPISPSKTRETTRQVRCVELPASPINNSLTLPPLPNNPQPSPVNGGTAAVPASNEADSSKSRLQGETPCKTLEEGRSLVPARPSEKCVEDELPHRLPQSGCPSKL